MKTKKKNDPKSREKVPEKLTNTHTGRIKSPRRHSQKRFQEIFFLSRIHLSRIFQNDFASLDLESKHLERLDFVRKNPQKHQKKRVSDTKDIQG